MYIPFRVYLCVNGVDYDMILFCMRYDVWLNLGFNDVSRVSIMRCVMLACVMIIG